jgi:hypothetical protein
MNLSKVRRHKLDQIFTRLTDLSGCGVLAGEGIDTQVGHQQENIVTSPPQAQ